MNDDLLYQVALTLIPQIGDVHARALVRRFGTARAIFDAKPSAIESLEGIGSVRARHIRQFKGFDRAAAELDFIRDNGITPLFFTDPGYPGRLLHCYDHPLLLYYKGTADLNAARIVAVVGTRSPTTYGKTLTAQLVEGLQAANVLIISGLAFGIDTIAHRSALRCGLPTIGVLAHGLDSIYPAVNDGLARQMVAQGGLLTDFPSNTKPDRPNFPSRNRIVAGLCDALIVVESGNKGGSLITADLANGYHKEVFALPGKATDPVSEGCNQLIRNHKASLLTCAEDCIESMGWNDKPATASPRQGSLFQELNPEEKLIVGLLREQESWPIDELLYRSGLSTGAMASLLLQLEMQGLVKTLPGKRYQVV
jgi:DNA processing protein